MILHACFKLGLIAVPIFSGFGYGAVAVRLQDSGAKVLFTADFLERRGRPIALKQKADEALAEGSAIERVVVWRYKGGDVPWTAGRDIWWHDFVAGQPEECAAMPLDSEAARACCSTRPAPPAAPRELCIRTRAHWRRPPRKST